MVFGMQWTMAAWCKVNRFPLGSFGYKIGATLQMHPYPACSETIPVEACCCWQVRLTFEISYRYSQVAKNAWKKIGNCHYLPMTSKGLGFHMKTSDHKTRKHTTPHCQTKWTSSVAIDTYTGEFGWDWSACDCYSLQGGRSSKTMGKHGNTLRSSQSSQKKGFSEALKGRIRYLKRNGPVSMTTPTSSIVMLVSAMLVAKMIFRTPAGGLSNTNLMDDGQLRVPVRKLRNGDITTLWKCMSQNVFNQSCLHSHCAKRNGAWWWMTRCMFKPKWLLIFVLQGAVQVENPWVCRVLRKLKS